MPHVSRTRLNRKVEQEISDLFLETLAKAKTKKEAEVFTTGFLTETEQIMLAKRLAIFFLLEKGIKPMDVKEILKVSFATVSRIAIWHKGLNKNQRLFINKILRKRKFKDFLIDILKEFYYLAPSKGTNWKRWRKEKSQWQREKKIRETFR